MEWIIGAVGIYLIALAIVIMFIRGATYNDDLE